MRIAFIITFLFVSLASQAQDSTEIKRNKLMNDLRSNFCTPWSYHFIDDSKTLRWDSIVPPFLSRIYLFNPTMKDTVLIYFLDAKHRDSAVARVFRDYLVRVFTADGKESSMILPQVNLNNDVVAVSYFADHTYADILNDKFLKDFTMMRIEMTEIRLEDVRQEEKNYEPPPPPPPRPVKKSKKIKG